MIYTNGPPQNRPIVSRPNSGERENNSTFSNPFSNILEKTKSSIDSLNTSKIYPNSKEGLTETKTIDQKKEVNSKEINAGSDYVNFDLLGVILSNDTRQIMNLLVPLLQIESTDNIQESYSLLSENVDVGNEASPVINNSLNFEFDVPTSKNPISTLPDDFVKSKPLSENNFNVPANYFTEKEFVPTEPTINYFLAQDEIKEPKSNDFMVKENSELLFGEQTNETKNINTEPKKSAYHIDINNPLQKQTTTPAFSFKTENLQPSDTFNAKDIEKAEIAVTSKYYNEKSKNDNPDLQINKHADYSTSQTSGNLNSASKVDIVSAKNPEINSVSTDNIFPQIVKQAKLLNFPDHTEIRIQLDPPSMGKISLILVSEDQHISINVKTAMPEIRELIQSNLPLLQSNLYEQGIRVDKLVVQNGLPSMWTQMEGRSSHSNFNGPAKKNGRIESIDDIGDDVEKVDEWNEKVISLVKGEISAHESKENLIDYLA